MTQKTIRIALASLKHPESVTQGVEKVTSAIKFASEKKSDFICFPETYIPGLRGASFDLAEPDEAALKTALADIQQCSGEYEITTIIGMEWVNSKGLLNLAYVISPEGCILGYQAKNQITPGGESENYVSDGKRKIFCVNGVKFGIAVCHEGWRYPETVRWAATRGAQIVFHPQVTGSNEIGDIDGTIQKRWGDSFYEKAMVCRAQENSIYYASINTAMRSQNSATSLISPTGECIAFVPYGNEQVLIQDIDLFKATRLYAKRYNAELYPE